MTGIIIGWNFWWGLLLAHIVIFLILFLFLLIVYTFAYIRWTYGLNTKFRIRIRAWEYINEELDCFQVYHDGGPRLPAHCVYKWTTYKNAVGRAAIITFFGGLHWIIAFYIVIGIAKFTRYIFNMWRPLGGKLLQRICLSKEERVKVALGIIDSKNKEETA